jgi:hypothetical protein
MPYTAQFFAEKLNVPVEYFNPFRSVQIDPSVNLEELSKVAHALGEVVGLGLRNAATCPVELNLMPESTLRWQSFNQKKPYFIATLASLVAMAFAVGFLFERLTGVKEKSHEDLQPTLTRMQAAEQRFKKAYGDLKRTQENLTQTSEWLDERQHWPLVCRELRQCLIRVEDLTRRKLGTDTGVWIEKVNMLNPSEGAALTPVPGGGAAPGFPPGMEGGPEMEMFRRRYGMAKGAEMAPPPPTPVTNPDGTPVDPSAAGGATVSTNEVGTIQVLFRSVNITAVPSGNSDIVFALQNELQSSSYFDPTNTAMTGQIMVEETTFTFGATLKLKKPLKL